MASGKDKDSDNGKEKEKDKDKDIELQVVVNGTPVNIKAKLSHRLGTLLVPALTAAGVAGEPESDRWVFKDIDGNMLDKEQKISEFKFSELATLFLSLEAGVAG